MGKGVGMGYRPIRVGLIGMGAIGQGVVDLLRGQSDDEKQIEIVAALVRDPERARPDGCPQTVTTVAELLAREPDVVVEVAGQGAAFKMINQLLAGVHIAAASEAIAFAAKQGLDIRKVYEVITASAGNSWMFENRMPHVLDGDYTPRSAVEIFVKDLGIIQDMARSQRFPVPVSAAALQMFLMTAASGMGRDDVVKRLAERAVRHVGQGAFPVRSHCIAVLAALASDVPEDRRGFLARPLLDGVLSQPTDTLRGFVKPHVNRRPCAPAAARSIGGSIAWPKFSP